MSDPGPGGSNAAPGSDASRANERGTRIVPPKSRSPLQLARQAVKRAQSALPTSLRNSERELTEADVLAMSRSASVGIKLPKVSNDSAVVERVSEFSGSGFDAAAFVSGKVQKDELEVEDLDRLLSEYQKVFEVVNEQLSASILQSHDDFVTAVNAIQALENDLAITTVILKNSRRFLGNVRDSSLFQSLELVTKHKKLERLLFLLNAASDIQALAEKRSSLSRLISTGKFPEAIATVMQGQTRAEALEHFACAGELKTRFQDNYSEIVTNLDAVLLAQSYEVDIEQYKSILEARKLLGSLGTVADILETNFISALTQTVERAVVGRIPRSVASGPEIAKKEIIGKCHCVLSSDAADVLLNVIEKVSCVIVGFWRIVLWHKDMEREGHFVEISEALSRWRSTFSEIVERRVGLVATALKLSSERKEDISRVARALFRLAILCEQVSCSPAAYLRDSIQKVVKQYCESSHYDNMVNAREMIENEGWQAMRSVYAVRDMRELQSDGGAARLRFEQMKLFNELVFFTRMNEALQAKSSIIEAVDEFCEEHASAVSGDPRAADLEPETRMVESPSQRVLVSHAEAPVDGAEAGDLPVVVPSAHSIGRFLGNYVALMEELPSVSVEYFNAYCEMFDLFLNTLRGRYITGDSRFVSDRDSFGSPNIDSDNTRARMQRELGRGVEKMREVKDQVGQMLRSTKATESGILEQAAAGESLEFLVKVAVFLQSRVAVALPKEQRQLISVFYSESVSDAMQLRLAMYRRLATAMMSIGLDAISQMVYNCRWDRKDPPVGHNPYVGILLREFSQISSVIHSLPSTVPGRARRLLWHFSVQASMQMLLDTFCRVKKCTVPGRGLMLLDLQTLSDGLDKLKPSKDDVLPGVEDVDVYIKAYYLPVEDIMDWVQENKNRYNLKHLVGLINSGLASQIKKKARQELIHSIEDIKGSN